MAEAAPGKLVLCGTPIGNLGDLTLRTIETLKAAHRIAAEDTRRTRSLLSHLGITGKPLVCLDAHAGEHKISALLDHVAAGETVAFVTDAGMPSVSDPGTALVQAATARGLPVTVTPGPSAVSTAIALSGLVSSAYFFAGFLPRQGKKRREAIESIAKLTDPVVIFEAANRTLGTLKELAEQMPTRQGALCRELTKLHEEVVRGELSRLAGLERELRGEIVLVLGGCDVAQSARPSDDELDERIRGELSRGTSARDITNELTTWSGRTRREVYARVGRLKNG